MKTAIRVLRPSGWLVALVPLVDSWQAAVFKDRWCNAIEAPRHTGLPTQEGMKRLLEGSGLTLRDRVSDSLLANAGVISLSFVPAAAVTIACGHRSFTARLFWRTVGISVTLIGVPFAWLESLFGHPRAGIFFAQKLSG